MKDYRLLMCIVKRDQYESYLNMLKSIGIEAQFASLCHGTASKSVLESNLLLPVTMPLMMFIAERIL